MRYTVKAKYRPNYGGFYRSGRYWPNGGVEVDESEVTAETRNEPMLIIEPVGVTVEEIPAGVTVDTTTQPKPRQRRGK